jgi:type IV pilus assembly protein PilQ
VRTKNESRHTGWAALLLAALLGTAPAAIAAGPYNLELRDTDIKDVLRLLGDQEGISILVAEDVSGKVTGSFKDVSFDEVLGSILRLNDLRSVREGTILRVEKRAALVAKGEVLDRKLFALDYAQADLLAKTVEKALSPDGTVVVDARTNSLLVRDTAASLEKLAALLAELDKPTSQVMIEARIVEANSNFARQLGIMWGFDYTHTGSAVTGGVSGGALPGGNTVVNLPSDPVYGALGVTFGRLDGSFNLDLSLSAMEDKGMGKVVSSPRIATLNNREATIKSGIKIPINTTQTTSGTNTTTTSIDFVEALLTLTVTPQVTSQGRVLLSIHANRSDPDWTRVVNGTPAITTREANTRVMVKDGETVVIGGLKQERTSDVDHRVPFLADIPLVGNLFKSTEKIKETEDLLIFITPRLVAS